MAKISDWWIFAIYDIWLNITCSFFSFIGLMSFLKSSTFNDIKLLLKKWPEIIDLILSIIFTSCSKDKKTVEVIEKKEIELQMIDSYQEGLEALENLDGYLAAKKFSEAELLFPQSEWAPKSALMASYSYYLQNYYVIIQIR